MEQPYDTEQPELKIIITQKLSLANNFTELEQDLNEL